MYKRPEKLQKVSITYPQLSRKPPHPQAYARGIEVDLITLHVLLPIHPRAYARRIVDVGVNWPPN
jgi:hypothetical protein